MVGEGTVLTAKGTLMRGTTFGVGEFTHADGAGFTEDDIALIKENGLNSVRFTIDLAWPYEDNEEENNKTLEATDRFVALAAKLGLYVWISAGLMWHDNGFVIFDHLDDFWRMVAPRYANDTNVFFDVVNEMAEPGWGDPMAGTSAQYLVSAYETIRELAPDTLCVLWSFSHAVSYEEIAGYLAETERLTSITWTNEVIGFHSYEATNGYYEEDTWMNTELMRTMIRWLRGQGYPIMNTEVPSFSVAYEGKMEFSDYPNPELLRVLEEEGVSWTSMTTLGWIFQPSMWRGVIERAGLTWTPDYGPGPGGGLSKPVRVQSAIATPHLTNTARRSLSEAESLEEMGNHHVNRVPSLMVTNGTYVTYESVNFGSLEPYSLTIRARGFVDGAVVAARQGGPDGRVIAELTLDRTDGQNPYYTTYLTGPISGVTDLSFTFDGPDPDVDHFALCYFIDWQFNHPPAFSYTVYTDIWNGPVPAANFGYRHNTHLWRTPSTDVGATTDVGRTLALTGITDGAQVLYDHVAFVPSGDTTFTVRAKALAGGHIEVYASRGHTIWTVFPWNYHLGHCEINGEKGVWTEYTLEIPEDIIYWVTYGGTFTPHGLDLMFRFVAAEGTAVDEELFEISEFTFTRD
jgi:hypothetical protein